MAHMKDNDRERIEFLASSGFTVQEIADDLGREKSTILREFINRSVESSRNYRRSTPSSSARSSSGTRTGSS